MSTCEMNVILNVAISNVSQKLEKILNILFNIEIKKYSWEHPKKSNHLFLSYQKASCRSNIRKQGKHKIISIISVNYWLTKWPLFQIDSFFANFTTSVPFSILQNKYLRSLNYIFLFAFLLETRNYWMIFKIFYSLCFLAFWGGGCMRDEIKVNFFQRFYKYFLMQTIIFFYEFECIWKCVNVINFLEYRWANQVISRNTDSFRRPKLHHLMHRWYFVYNQLRWILNY